MSAFIRYTRCDGYIRDLEEGRLQTQPGCTEEETLEVELTVHNEFILKLTLFWNTVNVVIFAGGKFPENVGKTFHMGVIFTILLLFP